MTRDLKKILRPIHGDIKKVDGKIRELVVTGVPIIDESCLHLFQGGGKFVRAALVLLASGLKGNSPEGAIEIASAVEIIHGASLIHDDIIDKSFLRRGVPAVHAKFGDKVAVLAGDFLYSLAMDIAANCGDHRILLSITKASNMLVMGELAQIEYSNIENITEKKYLDIIDRKTGRLMAASVEIGALRGGCSDDESSELYEAGLNLGFAFQITDDLLDFCDSSDISGKDVGNDYMDGKVTLPLIYILENGTDAEKDEIKKLMLDPEEEKWHALKDLVRSCGAFDYTRKRALFYAGEAKKTFEKIDSTKYGKAFSELVDFIIERNY